MVGTKNSKTVCYYNSRWYDYDIPILSSFTHATWLSGTIFDGARAFDGYAPDLDLHCARSIVSAKALGLNPIITKERIYDIAVEGIKKFPHGTHLYIKPMFWCDESPSIDLDPDSTRFCLSIQEFPLRPPTYLSICYTSRIKPLERCDITGAKASCLYPNNGKALRYALQKGFSDAIMCDIDGNVCELTSSNLFMVKEGVVYTPKPNGRFLNGLTRQRVIKLCKENGIPGFERNITPTFLNSADELFLTGNIHKVLPITTIEDTNLGIGSVTMQIRSLYFSWAKNQTI